MSDTTPIEHPNWLTSGDFAEAPEPFRLFADWFADATRSEPSNPNAAALATVDAAGLPNVRMVLLKGFDEAGFVFYSNRNSAKGQELAGNPKAALSFYWKSLDRQVRLRGTVTQVSDTEADAYFATRARGSQLGAWASQQSSPLGKPVRVREGGGADDSKIRDRQSAAPAVLDRLPRRAARDRVLARARVSPARAHRVHAREHRGGVGEDPALSVAIINFKKLFAPPACREANEGRASKDGGRSNHLSVRRKIGANPSQFTKK